jgi:hypothetical protein
MGCLYHDWAYICENTGSRKGHRSWPLGFQTGAWYEQSALETFILKRYPAELKYRWTSYQRTGKDIVNLPGSYDQPGPIAQLTTSVIDRYAAKALPSDLKTFYDTMRHGTYDEQQAAVNKLEKNPPDC